MEAKIECPKCYEEETIEIVDLNSDRWECPSCYFDEYISEFNVEVQMVSLFGDLDDAMITKKRDNGDEFVILDDDKKEEWMTEVIHEVHKALDYFMPDDTCYRFIERVAGELREGDGEADEDDLREMVCEIEPDIYTHNLTTWLNARNDHIYYLNQAQEMGLELDGFQLLTYAQKMYIEEIGNALISAVVETVEELETV